MERRDANFFHKACHKKKQREQFKIEGTYSLVTGNST